jgi:PST family polysaccharide transporter
MLGVVHTIRSKYFAGRPTLQKVLSNIVWLFLDKVLRMGVGLFVIAWIARYLGPEQFGLWNYAIAFTSLFGAFATLGLDGIVVRELVKTPERTNELLGTAFVLRLIGAVIAFTLSIGAAILIGNRDPLTLSLIALSAGGFIFQAFLTIDYFYQAHIISKYTVWSQNLAFLITSGVKILLIILEAPLLAFAIAGLVEIILGSIFLVFTYLYISKRPSHINLHSSRITEPMTAYSSPNPSLMFFNWKFCNATAKSLLKDSWPLMLSGLAIMIYMRIDQVMIKEMLGEEAVGLYSAAVRISEVWYFIPMVIASSVFPKIVEYKQTDKKSYYLRLQQYFTFMAWIGIIMGVLIFFSSKTIINILFGSAYIDASFVLMILVWSGIFVCLGVASSGWLITEGLQKISFFRTFLGAVCNVILNFILIPKFGISGAAFATLFSYSIAGYFVDLFNTKTRPIFFMKTKALFLLTMKRD